MGYENDLYRDETANRLCTLMRISKHLLNFGMTGRVKVRWKKQRATIAGSDSEAEEGEDREEINELFKVGKKIERIAVEIELVLENVMIALEVVAEEDAELNQLVKPTINKLKKLPHHGVLSLLKNWPEPLPVGSLPNINVRVAVLKILDDLPIDLKQHHRKVAKELVDKWVLAEKGIESECIETIQAIGLELSNEGAMDWNVIICTELHDMSS